MITSVENQEDTKKEEEVKQEELENNLESPSIEEEQQEKGVEETPEQINWRKVREAAAEKEKLIQQEREEKEKAQKAAREKQEQFEAMKIMVDKMLASQGKDPMTQQEAQEMKDAIDMEDIPTWGEQLKALPDVIKKVVLDLNKEEQAKKEEERKKKEVEEFPKKLRENHKDFNDVVTQENCLYLEYHHPEIAAMVSSMPDGYEKWSKVYSLIQKYVPIQDKQDTERLEKNMNKPVHGSGPSGIPTEAGETPVLSEAQRSANYQRMLKLARGG